MSFDIKLVTPKYHPSCFNELTFKGNIFSFIKLLTCFCYVFMSCIIVINSKIYKSKYPNTIW